MWTIIYRALGVLAQALTAFRLIKIFSVENYGEYAVYIFEINTSAALLSFGVISFNINKRISGYLNNK